MPYFLNYDGATALWKGPTEQTRKGWNSTTSRQGQRGGRGGGRAHHICTIHELGFLTTHTPKFWFKKISKKIRSANPPFLLLFFLLLLLLLLVLLPPYVQKSWCGGQNLLSHHFLFFCCYWSGKYFLSTPLHLNSNLSWRDSHMRDLKSLPAAIAVRSSSTPSCCWCCYWMYFLSTYGI